ncbi:unnamed protein product [Lactuca virosa]|uniref:Large ribosomal subunit protein uL30m n=1 Tax=Lactuca virosa TaxID=75947 RepID=A0AAU9PII1_9ASTR|nr:unnamed protein product [Lactuca virosa]
MNSTNSFRRRRLIQLRRSLHLSQLSEDIKMNAYKAYKACAPIAWSPNLYITLVRGIPGTRKLHRRTLEALRLGKCNRTVMRWNTPTVRGMLQQVKRLVVIETEEMFKARKEKEAKHRCLISFCFVKIQDFLLGIRCTFQADV